MSVRRLVLLYTDTAATQVEEMRGGMEDAVNTPLAVAGVPLGVYATIVMA